MLYLSPDVEKSFNYILTQPLLFVRMSAFE